VVRAGPYVGGQVALDHLLTPGERIRIDESLRAFAASRLDHAQLEAAPGRFQDLAPRLASFRSNHQNMNGPCLVVSARGSPGILDWH
jgi:hypothetical protein